MSDQAGWAIAISRGDARTACEQESPAMERAPLFGRRPIS